MTSDKQQPSHRARTAPAHERAHDDHDHRPGAVSGRWARHDAQRIAMDISDDFFRRHSHLIASTASFRSSGAKVQDSPALTARVARVGAEARERVSDGVPVDDLDPHRGSGRA